MIIKRETYRSQKEKTLSEDTSNQTKTQHRHGTCMGTSFVSLFSTKDAFIFTVIFKKLFFCLQKSPVHPSQGTKPVGEKGLLDCTAWEILQFQAVGESDAGPSVSHKNPLQQLTLACGGNPQQYFKQRPKIILVLSCNIYHRARDGTEPRADANVSISNTST